MVSTWRNRIAVAVAAGIRRGGRSAAAVHRLGVVAVLVIASPAWSEVTLETAVSKVESILDSGGRVRRELTPAESVVPGEELRYTITFTNESETPVDGGRIVITNDIPDGTVYVSGTAGGDAAAVEYSADGERFGPSEPAAGPQGAPAATRSGTGSEDANPAVGTLRWTHREELGPGESSQVYFHVRMQ